MTVNRDQLFADLDALTEEQIEVGLAAGVWGEPDRPLVQHYLSRMKLERAEAAAAEQRNIARSANAAALIAANEASKAKVRATAALIIAAGAMLAAMAAAFIAFLALRKYGFEAPW